MNRPATAKARISRTSRAANTKGEENKMPRLIQRAIIDVLPITIIAVVVMLPFIVKKAVDEKRKRSLER